MANGSGEPSATALVGMDGFVVKSQIVHDGEHWLLVETADPFRWCPKCGTVGVGNGRRRVKVRDLAIAGTPTVLVWAKPRTYSPDEWLTTSCLKTRPMWRYWPASSVQSRVAASIWLVRMGRRLAAVTLTTCVERTLPSRSTNENTVSLPQLPPR